MERKKEKVIGLYKKSEFIRELRSPISFQMKIARIRTHNKSKTPFQQLPQDTLSREKKTVRMKSLGSEPTTRYTYKNHTPPAIINPQIKIKISLQRSSFKIYK